jgi:hypothetical protein
MASAKGRLADLKFDPSIDEQLLLSQVQSKNVMLSYREEENLYRVVSLIILLVISQETSNATIPRILYLTKRNYQLKLKKKLNELVNQTVTIHNGGILPVARKQDYNRFSVIISTPKTVKNDLKEDFFPSNQFSLILIDYAEMGASSSSLRYLIDKLKELQIIGITRDQNLDKIKQACINLKLKEVIKIQNEEPSVIRSNIQHLSFPLPKEYWLVLNLLDRIKRNEMKHLEQLGFNVSSKSKIREIAAIHASVVKEKNSKLSIKTANLQRIMNLQKIVVSEGFPSVTKYLSGLNQRLKENENFVGRKSIIFFLKHPIIRKLQEFIDSYRELEHPKVRLVYNLVNKYNTGISIVTNNHSNSEYLKEYLKNHEITVIHLTQPITSFSKLQLGKKLYSFTGKKTQVCISNSANQFIADNSNIIIAYDVSADIVRSLDNLSTSILRIFLVAKQTADDARFNQLKKLGNSTNINYSDYKDINQALQVKEEEKSSKKDNSSESISRFSILLSPDLYESKIPYLFPEKDFIRGVSTDLPLPSYTINKKYIFLIISPETIGRYDFQTLSTDLDHLCQDCINVSALIYPQTLETLKLEYRSEILNIFQTKGIIVALVKSNEEIYGYTRLFLEKQ